MQSIMNFLILRTIQNIFQVNILCEICELLSILLIGNSYFCNFSVIFFYQDLLYLEKNANEIHTVNSYLIYIHTDTKRCKVQINCGRHVLSHIT